MFSVKLKVKEDPRSYSLPRRKFKESSSLSSSTPSLNRYQSPVPKKSSFLSYKNGSKSNKKVRIQTTFERSSPNLNGRWTEFAVFFAHLNAATRMFIFFLRLLISCSRLTHIPKNKLCVRTAVERNLLNECYISA
jgi:hypothetical protein